MTAPDKAAMLEIIAQAADETAEHHRHLGNKSTGMESVTSFAIQDAFNAFARELRAIKKLEPEPVK